MSCGISSAKMLRQWPPAHVLVAWHPLLSNLNNKSKLIVLLCEHFTAFYTVYQVEADDDAEILCTAVASCDMSPIMLVINTDLLVLCVDWYGKRPHPLFFKLEPKHTTIKLRPPLHMQNTRPYHQLLSRLCINLGRVHLQVQEWLGRHLDPTAWGGKCSVCRYKPIMASQGPAF